MLSFHKSKNLPSNKDFNDEPIYLFQQFFVHKDENRQKNEIQFCLKKNVENPFIEKFFLLNEKIYSNDELGVETNKIVQKKVKGRMKYIDIFKYVKKRNLKGYIVFSNSDIFFDDTINNLRRTDFHKEKNFIALLRYDYNPNKKSSKIFGPRFDSQDAWIIHTDHLPKKENLCLFDFRNGIPGCDNKLIFVAKMLNYNIYNVPKLIHINHVQKDDSRDYHGKRDIIPRPHIYFEPYGYSTKLSGIKSYIDVFNMNENIERMNYDDNIRLYNYISTKCVGEKNFYIPTITGPECVWAYIVYTISKEKKKASPDVLKQHLKDLELSNLYFDDDLQIGTAYADLYLKSLGECEVYTCNNLYDKESMSLGPALQYLNKQFDKPKLWREVFNIGNFALHDYNWAKSLSYKKVLVISHLSNKISEDKRNPNNFFKNNKLFENTVFTFMEYKTDKIEGHNPIDIANVYLGNIVKADFDIALLDCQGLGNILAHAIYSKLNKSAINVGEMLPLLFGYYTNNYKKLNPDVAKMFINKKWECLDKI